MQLTDIKTLDDLEITSRRLLMRVDFNCPLGPDGAVADDSRITAVLPTIQEARKRGAKVILCSHLGRPKGKHRPELSLEPVGARLAELLDHEVFLPDNCIGDGPRKLAMNLRDGQVLLLENLRFHAGEEKNDDNFCRALASLGQVYVNDAFGAAHRAHASVVGVPKLMTDRAAGRLMLSELTALTSLLRAPEAPFVAVVGGAKVSGKIGVIENLLGRCDAIIIGGAMAYTFLLARGMSVGSSLVEEDKLAVARRVLMKAEGRGTRILLPVDHICAPELSADSPIGVYGQRDIPASQMGLDIGPDTVALFTEAIAGARTVFWNGPLGAFETEPFAAGTMAVAKAIASMGGVSVVGGGDTIAAVRRAGVTPFITHISTGGGASLELLEGKELPGVEALRTSRKAHDV